MAIEKMKDPEVNEFPVLTSLINEFKQIRSERDDVKAKYENLEEQYRAIEGRLWEALDVMNVTSIRVPGFGTLSRRETIYAQVQDKERAFEIFDSMGLLQEMTELQFIKAKLNEWVKEQLQSSGGALPEGIGFTSTRYISVRR